MKLKGRPGIPPAHQISLGGSHKPQNDFISIQIFEQTGVEIKLQELY